jgi:hypothetical protein
VPVVELFAEAASAVVPEALQSSKNASDIKRAGAIRRDRLGFREAEDANAEYIITLLKIVLRRVQQ